MTDVGPLRQVAALAPLPDVLLQSVAAEMDDVFVQAGEWVMREGDPAADMYIVTSGQLEVVAEGPPETIVRTLRRGAVLGELALLGGETRSISVRALRDSHLLGLGRAQFDALVESAPGFAAALLRSVGRQLSVSRAPTPRPPSPKTVAVLGLTDEAPVREAATFLEQALRGFGSVIALQPRDGGTEGSMELLDRAESGHDRVVMVADPRSGGRSWNDFCLCEAHSVIAVASGTPRPAWGGDLSALRGCELIAVGTAISDEALSRIGPREFQSIPGRGHLAAAMQSTARCLAGRSVGLVLSGGGTRAMAHLGVVEELDRTGIAVERIGGVSLGAVVGAGVASGRDPAAILDAFRTERKGPRLTGDYTLPLFSLIRGQRARRTLTEYLGARRIEELPKRFFCLSCDLVGREPVIHRTGSLLDAVTASFSIPGVFPPVVTADGRLLVDGGILDNLPVETMAQTGEGPVIAVDVTGRNRGIQSSPTRPKLARLAGPLRRYLSGGSDRLPSIGETVARAVTVGSVDTELAARRHADVLIQPSVEGIGMLDWDSTERAVEAGREAARGALEAISELI